MNEKELIKRLVVCLIIILACYFAFAYIGTRNVHDNGNGTDTIRNELRSIEKAQREETRVIDETEKAISRSQKGIDESTRTNKEITSIERKDTEIIDECQQILKRVRERNTSKD
ncbi:hypothetical protein HMPREF9220_1076 [Dialister micraerophilus UPII 345-E]|uniref:Uncharacterized protein n=1 Tax=Dialister micraerophilus UPII 345-E TaxID=910314 RepID=E4L893_9FIRM|nr:hypothetical protein HMPREF9220_1076 [Dialister micraerophilus UPII 345-E]